MEFVSNHGEIVEAKNKAAFCKQYGISNSRSLKNAAGALANDGQRWKVLDTETNFDLPKLYLGNYVIKNKKTGINEHIARSETADEFMICLSGIRSGKLEGDNLEFAKSRVTHIQSQYNIIDNRHPDDVISDVLRLQITPLGRGEYRYTNVDHLSTAAKYRASAAASGTSIADKRESMVDFFSNIYGDDKICLRDGRKNPN